MVAVLHRLEGLRKGCQYFCFVGVEVFVPGGRGWPRECGELKQYEGDSYYGDEDQDGFDHMSFSVGDQVLIENLRGNV